MILKFQICVGCLLLAALNFLFEVNSFDQFVISATLNITRTPYIDIKL